MQSVIMPIIAVNIIFFIIQFFSNTFTVNFMLVPNQVFARPWILITSMFLHGSFSHLFFNMYGLLIFGPLLERSIGPSRFLFMYMISGIVAAIGHVVLNTLLFGGAAPALGASGAIMGMLGTLIILMPELRILFFFAIPMPLKYAGFVWAAIDVLGIFVPSGVANIAHLAGMATGLLYGLYLKNKGGKYQRKFRKTSHITIEDADEYMKFGRI